MHRTIRYITQALAVILLANCGSDSAQTVRSDAVATGQIYATYQLVSDGTGDVYVEAQLTKNVPPSQSNESETFVRLVTGDELWLSAGANFENIDFSDDLFGKAKELTNSQVLFSQETIQNDRYDFIFFRTIINTFGIWYSAKLPENENNEYHITLLRAESNATPRESRVALPESFSIISPKAGDSFSRSQDDILVEWENIEADTSVELEVNVTCANLEFDSYSANLAADTGMHIIPAGSFTSPLLENTCSATLNIRKYRTGQFSPAFVGGTVTGYQIRRLVLSSEP